MQRRVKKIKQEANGFPPVPKDWDDLAEFPDKFSKTYDNNWFLLANIEQSSGDRMLVFASNRGLKFMQRAETWTCDGTFQTVPPPFNQLYSFIVEVDGLSYPACVAVLANKKGPTYQTLLEIINQKVTWGSLFSILRALLWKSWSTYLAAMLE
jgi:hypothetical protein